MASRQKIFLAAVICIGFPVISPGPRLRPGEQTVHGVKQSRKRRSHRNHTQKKQRRQVRTWDTPTKRKNRSAGRLENRNKIFVPITYHSFSQKPNILSIWNTSLNIFSSFMGIHIIRHAYHPTYISSGMHFIRCTHCNFL